MRFYVIALGVAVAIALVGCNEDSAKAPEPATSAPEESVAITSPETTSDGVPAIGTKAPSITVANSLNNNDAIPNLDDYLGQVVVLDFWAYW